MKWDKNNHYYNFRGLGPKKTTLLKKITKFVIMKKIFTFLVISLTFFGCEKETLMYKLSVSSNPSEGGTINPTSGEYEEGTEVIINVTPNTHYEFEKWSGNWNGYENPLTIVMDCNKTIIGNFKLMDSDGDGVTDDVDTCSETPFGEQVDVSGCSDSQKDSDGDGVNNDVDTCPNTQSGETVDLNGCSDSQKDTDGDGVMDDVDQCIDTPIGKSVDSNGCILVYCNVDDLSDSLKDGLVGMWTFCGNSNDLTSTSNNGTLYGPQNSEGKHNEENTSYLFDGIDDYIELSDSFFGGSTSVDSFTFYTLVKVNSYENGRIFGKEGYWRTISLQSTKVNDKDVFWFGGSQPSPQQYFNISSNSEYELNKWYNLVITFNNGELKMYINGVLENSKTISLTTLNWSFLTRGNSTSTNHFGRSLPVNGNHGYFNGEIDDFLYWERVLTQDEIQLLNR